MGRFKKIVIITSLSLNAVFFLIIILVSAKFMYIRFTGNPSVFSFPFGCNSGYSSKQYEKYEKNRLGKKDKNDDDDDDDDEDDDQDGDFVGRRIPRDLARKIYSKPEVIENFEQLHDIHEELIKISRLKNFDEERFRMLFDDIDDIIISNKNIVVNELATQMRGMEVEKRVYLIKEFLRMARPQ